MFKKIILIVFFFLLSAKSVQACDFSSSPAHPMAGQTVTFTIIRRDVSARDYDITGTYNSSPIVTHTQTLTSGAPYSFPISTSVVGELVFEARAIDDSCSSRVTIISATAPPSGSGNPLQKPIEWLPYLTRDKIGFGADPALGLDFFKKNVVAFLISLITFLVFVLSLIFLLVGAIMWITSGGNKEGAAKAKAIITNALIGLVLGISVFIILGIIDAFLGTRMLGP